MSTRLPFDPPPHPPPTPPGPPSAPVNVISSVNGTSVHLEWDRPLDTGGRSDLQYSVLCQKCSGEGGPCETCDSHPGLASGGKTGASVAAGSGGLVERSGTAAIRFLPRQSGLTEPRVTVLNLLAHSNYSFRILATNAVTPQSNEPSLYALANITTNQAGRAPQRVGIHASQTPAALPRDPFLHHSRTATLLKCLNNVEPGGANSGSGPSPQPAAPVRTRDATLRALIGAFFLFPQHRRRC